jgi:hypothetical protein
VLGHGFESLPSFARPDRVGDPVPQGHVRLDRGGGLVAAFGLDFDEDVY